MLGGEMSSQCLQWRAAQRNEAIEIERFALAQLPERYLPGPGSEVSEIYSPRSLSHALMLLLPSGPLYDLRHLCVCCGAQEEIL